MPSRALPHSGGPFMRLISVSCQKTVIWCEADAPWTCRGCLGCGEQGAVGNGFFPLWMSRAVGGDRELPHCPVLVSLAAFGTLG